MEQMEWYVDEMDDNAKQFASELNKLPTSEDTQDNIKLQDIIDKNEIAYKIDRNVINGYWCRSIYSNKWANT